MTCLEPFDLSLVQFVQGSSDLLERRSLLWIGIQALPNDLRVLRRGLVLEGWKEMGVGAKLVIFKEPGLRPRVDLSH